ncbi:MAG: hypothetical protein QXU93_11700 [Thermoproteus sp.]
MSESVLDCELDFEELSRLPPVLQTAVLNAIRSGMVPGELRSLFARLRRTGALICKDT